MNEICFEFIKKIVSINIILKNAEDEVIVDWQPDDPPPTTLFAALGNSIYEFEQSLSDNELKDIFDLIESVMGESNDSLLDVYVATGMLESMSCGSRLSDERWIRFRHFSGEKTWAYVNNW